MDLNTNSLDSASRRLGEVAHSRLTGDMLEPLPDGVGPFDSIGVNYLFHCVPGTWARKGRAYLSFRRVDVEVVGTVAVFNVREPRR